MRRQGRVRQERTGEPLHHHTRPISVRAWGAAVLREWIDVQGPALGIPLLGNALLILAACVVFGWPIAIGEILLLLAAAWFAGTVIAAVFFAWAQERTAFNRVSQRFPHE
jgi:hypothetical protein